MTTLVQSIPSRRVAAIGVFGFAAAVAAASQIAIPLPFTPVPLTLQPMLVILAGMMLGPAAGAASMVFYLALGSSGAPVFTPVGAPGVLRFLGPTGGYLIAYPAAAWVAGALTRRASSLSARWLAGVAGIAVIYLGSVARAIQMGVTPFAALDLVKAWIAAVIVSPRASRQRA